MRKVKILSIFFLFLSLSSFAQTSDVMLQGFDWVSGNNSLGWYNVIASKAVEMKAAGINTIWLPPPSDANDGGNNAGYLPRKLYVLDAHFGTTAQLINCVSILHQNNIKVLADIVINHRVGVTNATDYQNPNWGCWSVVNNDETNAGCGNGDSGEGLPYAADIDHSNITVQNDLKAWMNWLKTYVGFDGWRYDFVKGYSGSYTALYNKATNPYFSVGEFWDGDRQKVQNWVDAAQQTSAAFDFPTKYLLHQAVNGNYGVLNVGGKAGGLIGWSPTKSVTFIDNHDSYKEAANVFPGDNFKVLQGYAYILTHPGIPMIFWDHYFDWVGYKSKLDELIKVRKDNGISANSTLTIVTATNNLYAAIIDNKVAMKMGSTDWNPGAGWTLRTSGVNYAVWDKSSNITANFTQSATSGNTPLNVSFNASTSTATAGIKTYTWNFGDGTTATGVSVTKIYTTAGTFSVTLTVTDNNNITSTKTSTINTVTQVTDSVVVYFENTANWATPKIYYWGNTPVAGMGTTTWPGVNMQLVCDKWFKFVLKGTTSTSLIFNDGGTNKTADLIQTKGIWNYSWTNKTWASGAKTCSTLVPSFTQSATTGNTPLTVTFNAASSVASAGIKSYTWNFGDGTTATGISATKIYTTAGTFSVTLTVTDNNNTSATKISTVTTVTPNTDSIVVYFENTANWAAPKIYYWNSVPAGSNQTVTWPGVSMGLACGQWYKYTFKATSSINVIFTNVTGTQTADLSVTKGIWKYSWTTKTWLSGLPTCAIAAARGINTSSINILNIKKGIDVTAYPNPVKDNVNISYTLSKSSDVSISIFDEMGKKVATILNSRKHAGKNILQLHTQKFVAGLYNVIIQTNTEMVSKKIVIVH